MSSVSKPVPGVEATSVVAGEGLPGGPAVLPGGPPGASPREDRSGLAAVAACLVIAATGWYLLKEFTLLLRPLLLAVFLCYAILPGHRRLTRHISPLASMAVLAGLTVALMLLLAWLVVGSAVQLAEDTPRLVRRGQEFVRDAREYYAAHVPPWMAGDATTLWHGEELTAGKLQDAAASLASAAAGTVTEAVVVGIYLIFLLLEAGRVPQRIQSGFSGGRAKAIQAVLGNISAAMADYLRVKVRVNLLLAVPVTVVLWAFGVRFALTWGVLTFLLNFIPYLGSVVACSGPVLLAFLELDSLGRASAVAALLVAIHLSSAYFVEPALTGRAVGLSPVVVLVALSFWGLCWGVIGMLLAIPLTVMLKIVFENIPFTRPLARLMSDEG
jgi:AI-2 transport protein TqsA